MRAMVLAAGMGQRLRPLTDKLPKALVAVGGVPMLEIVLRRLICAGVDRAVINVHHLGGQIEDFLRAKRNFGITIEISRESELLETGGGLKKAAGFFDDGKPFFLHNADVLSDIDLAGMYRFHMEKGPLATLAVQARASGRYLLFDREGLLRGWQSPEEKRRQWAGKPVEDAQRLAFNGIHVISPGIFPKLTEAGAFSITRAYLRLAGQGEPIRAFRCDGCTWGEIGDLPKLEEARRRAQAG